MRGALLSRSVPPPTLGSKKTSPRPLEGSRSRESQRHLQGNPDDLDSLRSWTSRIIVINLGSKFTPDFDKVKPAESIFGEDPDLKRCLGSPEARMAYTHSFLIPFLQTFSADDCISKLPRDPYFPIFKNSVLKLSVLGGS